MKSITEVLNGLGEPIPTAGSSTLATATVATLAAAIGAAVALAIWATATTTALPVKVTNQSAVNGAVSVTNFPATQPVSGMVDVSNFPVSQAITGSVSISNLPTTQPVSGSVSVSNFPATFGVSNFPATFGVSNFPVTQPVSGSVSVSNLPVTQTIATAALTATATTSASIALSSVLVVGANANRKGFTLWNNSANSTYCCFAATCTSSVPANIVATFTSWVFTLPYTGQIACIRNAGSGTVTVYELQ